VGDEAEGVRGGCVGEDEALAMVCDGGKEVIEMVGEVEGHCDVEAKVKVWLVRGQVRNGGIIDAECISQLVV